MQLSYRARLKRDLQHWQEQGFIRPDQAERIAGEALAARGFDHLQAALILCFVLLTAPAIIAFVAANWAVISPFNRMLVLFSGNGLVVLAACLATMRQARDPSSGLRFLADGLATLSLVFAASSITLIAQTFHLPSDPQGFARTIAALGLVTALVTRSGGAALIACGALILGDATNLAADLFGSNAANTGWAGFWMVAPALFLASLSGWIPARRTILLLVLLAVAGHFSRVVEWMPVQLSPGCVVTVTALALALGRLLERPSAANAAPTWIERFREGGEALSEAAAGLCLIGILVVTFDLREGDATGFETSALFAPLALGLAAFVLLRDRFAGRGGWPLADLSVLAAASLSLLIWYATGEKMRESAVLSVWGGIVPALALVVAAHIEELRALFGWGLALCAALTLFVLFQSSSLIALSGNLFLSAILVGLALTASRWLETRAIGRSA